jgi:hypothetical protein
MESQIFHHLDMGLIVLLQSEFCKAKLQYTQFFSFIFISSHANTFCNVGGSVGGNGVEIVVVARFMG